MGVLRDIGHIVVSRSWLWVSLLLGMAGILYLTVRFGWEYGFLFSFLPLGIFLLSFPVRTPSWALLTVFVMNYFIMGLDRYVPGLSGGVVMDGLLCLILALLLIKSIGYGVEWKYARNEILLISFIWFLYCFFELLSPFAGSVEAWTTSVRGIGVYFVILVLLTLLLLHRYSYLRLFLVLWSVLTLLAVCKVLIQRYVGFDSSELRWLFVDGGARTHIIRTGIRYFSFFTDAANFGSGMGFSMVVFSIASFYVKHRWLKFYFGMVALAAAYGLMMSGTRSALAVPFAGCALFLLISGKWKIAVGGTVLLIGVFCVLNYTTIGQSNASVRRMRSAFNKNDPSFMVRLANQKRLRSYMVAKPFGVGVGMGGVKAKRFDPDAIMSQIPTDSWLVLIWVETGIVGLLLYLGLYVWFFIRGAVIIYRIQNKELRGILCALLAGTFGMMVSSYANEIIGQFPNGYIVYMSQAFIFMGPVFDRELQKDTSPQTETVWKLHF